MTWRVVVESWITPDADWFGRREFSVDASSLPAALREIAALPPQDYLDEDRLTIHSGKVPRPKADLDRILLTAIRANNIRQNLDDLRTRMSIEHAIVGSPGAEIRTLMVKAWRAGYAAGRTDTERISD